MEFEKGMKFDEGKTEFLLLDLDFLEECSKVMMKGKEKYGFENWKKQLDPIRIENALFRHFKAYCSGEKFDKESGYSHLSHIMCNSMFLWWYDHK